MTDQDKEIKEENLFSRAYNYVTHEDRLAIFAIATLIVTFVIIALIIGVNRSRTVEDAKSKTDLVELTYGGKAKQLCFSALTYFRNHYVLVIYNVAIVSTLAILVNTMFNYVSQNHSHQLPIAFGDSVKAYILYVFGFIGVAVVYALRYGYDYFHA